MNATIHHGDCLEIMATLPDASVDAIVTDPPYGLAFMGKRWDHGVPGVEFWANALRVAKPGAHLLAFGGTRTYHRIACAIEEAGWEIRDCVMWVYGSGFPKSHDVSKAIDKAAGARRESIPVGSPVKRMIPGADQNATGSCIKNNGREFQPNISEPATEEARRWNGFGTALKPAWEPIIVARKPLCGTVAENVLKHGTGGINVDGCRVAFHGEADKAAAAASASQRLCQDQNKNRTAYGKFNDGPASLQPYLDGIDKGRWPANVIHDGSDEVVGLFPQTTSGSISLHHTRSTSKTKNDYGARAARFFYCAKASKADRDEGVAGVAGVGALRDGGRKSEPRRNHHPTVKPTALMRYLCRLVTPPGGVVLDPFTGSGSTGKAAILEGFQFIGIERETEYCEIARARIAAATPPLLPGMEPPEP